MSFENRAHQYDPLPPELADRWAYFPHWEGKRYFVNLVGIEVEELRTDYARMSMPFKEENLQAAEIMHGGVIATLIDTVVVPAIGAGLAEGSLWSTIELHVLYHRPLVTDAVAEGWVVKRGKSVVFTQGEVFDAEGRLVASGTATYLVKPPD
ncbi:MAG: PaaI family thioesterase [Acidimicrobiales bacterium]|nr:PaaI family thioesterase [Acidimicrobiia bacterium]NNC80321.1 PaaI family thioesterase [Acidimicrobiales bacterium]RZV48780.1 MAG: PaaI family thioesterase [Acidimicrobiales bacterium]